MTITPNDIANKEFKKVFRGYDADEVDEFLDQIVEEYEKIYKENLNLKEKISTLNEKIEHYANIESTLQNTLVLAQSAAEQAKENSKKEAEMILNNAKEKSEELIKDAQNRANQIISEAQQRVLEINKEYEMLRQEFNMFRSRFKGLLQAQLETIEKFE
ncbi:MULTISPECIES: DivIVA domain-containing protein [Caloramator]|jgi:cell division initiation protein|uniref:Cell division initiation protein DivIVA n=2 Tax=Caloramator TaxID=44258 RepID=I7KU69_9CLOT|nr:MULTISPECIES: DivIVA domain-containing protein [Caloramator]MDO6354382.1 DivIVA domain-containing protein [Caloramator sp. CAR-1]CCJ33388.1 Cell division initiation protein DivIVA [Caloramator australicus RC3]